MHRDRSLGGGPKTEVTSSRRKQSSSKRDQRRLSLWPSCGELRHGLRPPGETKARKDKHSTAWFVHAALSGG
jgi:hypothetical protein